MPLTQEQQNAIFSQAMQVTGCPPIIKDRIDAYAKGMENIILMIKDSVSLDTPDSPDLNAGVDELLQKAKEDATHSVESGKSAGNSPAAS